MKRTYPVIFSVSAFFLFLLACTRIDTTELGNELIPAVDNVTTFDTTLLVETDNLLLPDTTRTFSDDDIAVGYISNDPEFGRTTADMYFTLGASAYGTYPFRNTNPDSVDIDSVVLSLAYAGSYGDTNTAQTFRVFEIGTNANFKDSAYRISHADFAPLGAEIGSKSVTFKDLNDTILLSRVPDTPKVVNVMRIRLNNSLGRKFAGYSKDSVTTGGYFSDSLFRTLFRGLAVKPDRATGNGLAYFNLADKTKSKVIVYFRVTSGGKRDTTFAEFYHNTVGQANLVQRTPGGGYATYLGNGNPNDDLLYIQGSPGSYVQLRIPGLSTLSNRVIHRAELIVSRIPNASENTFALPNQLFLDMITEAKDSAYTLQNDFLFTSGGTNATVFGGNLRTSDNTYRFNISRSVQGIVTRKERNLPLRLYAPFETSPYYLPPGKFSDVDLSLLARIPIRVIQQLGYGRVVLHGGAAADPAKKLRLYIIYSKI
ncbi:MAG: DUF4270 family protein [Chitinophagaceae bacterium]